MSLGRTIGFTLGGLVLGGGFGAALGAGSGATGAAILTKAGYSGYVGLEAAIMGAIGCGILSGSIGALSGALVSCCVDSDSSNKETLSEEQIAQMKSSSEKVDAFSEMLEKVKASLSATQNRNKLFGTTQASAKQQAKLTSVVVHSPESQQVELTSVVVRPV